MGCVASKADLNELQPNVFRVWNVNDARRPLTPGQLEVTESELVLHQRGREPIRWPMRCLRRYGFDSELFSFESGRRCPTGPNIYAFKCRRAEELFNLLQEQIRASGQDEQSHSSGGGAALASFNMPRSASVSEAGYLEPISRPRGSRGPTSLPNSLSSSSTGLLSPTARTNSPHYMNDGDLRSTTPPATSGGGGALNLAPLHEYVNSSVIESSSSSVSEFPLMELVSVRGCNGCRVTRGDDNYARLDDLLKQEHSAKQRLYVNIKPEEKSSSPALSQDHYYANIKMSPTGVQPPANLSPSPSDSICRQVNYVVLDLDQGGGGGSIGGGVGGGGGEPCITPTSPLSDTSVPESEGYATIDFDKTAALSHSANPGPDKDDSQRKTRHNSTITDLILSRHNSAISE